MRSIGVFRSIIGFLSLVLVVLPHAVRAADDGHTSVNDGVLVVGPGSMAIGGGQTISVLARDADLQKVLTAVLSRSGMQYVIDPDIHGKCNLNIQNATIGRVLDLLVQTSAPDMRIARSGQLLRIYRDQGAAGFQAGIDQRMLSQPGGSAQVSLTVSMDRPIPLVQALLLVGEQAHVAISIDKRVPTNLKFCGTITRQPAALVVQVIAREARLKVEWDQNTVLLAPIDSLAVRSGQHLVGAWPELHCKYCGEPLDPVWRFCPQCGRIVPGPALKSPGG